jgi:hypothetical protein
VIAGAIFGRPESSSSYVAILADTERRNELGIRIDGAERLDVPELRIIIRAKVAIFLPYKTPDFARL